MVLFIIRYIYTYIYISVIWLFFQYYHIPGILLMRELKMYLYSCNDSIVCYIISYNKSTQT